MKQFKNSLLAVVCAAVVMQGATAQGNTAREVRFDAFLDKAEGTLKHNGMDQVLASVELVRTYHQEILEDLEKRSTDDSVRTAFEDMCAQIQIITTDKKTLTNVDVLNISDAVKAFDNALTVGSADSRNQELVSRCQRMNMALRELVLRGEAYDDAGTWANWLNAAKRNKAAAVGTTVGVVLVGGVASYCVYSYMNGETPLTAKQLNDDAVLAMYVGGLDDSEDNAKAKKYLAALKENLDNEAWVVSAEGVETLAAVLKLTETDGYKQAVADAAAEATDGAAAKATDGGAAAAGNTDDAAAAADSTTTPPAATDKTEHAPAAAETEEQQEEGDAAAGEGAGGDNSDD